MINYGHGTVGFVLTFISLVHILLAALISLMIVMILIYEQVYRHVKRIDQVTLVIFTLIYCLIFIYGIVLSTINIQTLLGDIYGTNFDSTWCRFNGYWMIVLICAIYQIFVVQAIFRLCRIIYPNYRQLQSYPIFMIGAFILIVVASLLLCPILIWHDIVYILNDHYCFIRLRNIRGMLWMISMCYGVPELCLSIIYMRIIVYIRAQPNNLTQVMKQRQQRDLAAIRRIFINIGSLILLGMPGIVLSLMSYAGVEYPLRHRILWLGTEISLTVLSIEMVVMTPQLKNIVMRKWHRNRVLPIELSIRRRPAEDAQ